jgi:hypothetical protein
MNVVTEGRKWPINSNKHQFATIIGNSTFCLFKKIGLKNLQD